VIVGGRERRAVWWRVVLALCVLGLVMAAWALVSRSGSDDRTAGPASAPVPPPVVQPPPNANTAGPLHQLLGANACIKGPASPSWTHCPATAAGLQDARSVAISRDGRFVYVASQGADAVAAFARSARTGALRQLQGANGCISDPAAPPSTVCGRTANGLRGAMTATLSPDGRNLYVASIDGESVVSLTRDRRTGALRPVAGAAGCLKDPSAQGIACTASSPALHGARWVAVSPDGRNVYVAAPAADAIVAFARNPANGALRLLPGMDECVKDARRAGTSCPISVHGLREPRMVTVSPDGRNVYAVGEHSYSVVAFSRDPASGGMRPLPGDDACIEDVRAGTHGDCPSKADGLNFAFSVTISPDGRFAYVASDAGDAVAQFSRDTKSGALHPLPGRDACIRDVHSTLAGCRQTARGLDGAVSVDIAPDGRFAYVASFYGEAVAVFSRNPATGALHQLPGAAACLADPRAPSKPATTSCASDATGLEGPRDVAISPDGRNAYVPASIGADVAVFSRTR
jgi:6-phosphogluconolactonase (cycloisomerase 2 family)